MSEATLARSFETITTNGVNLRAVVAGDGPLVILLHGFPQGWSLWRHQIDPLVAAGFRVAVPDQRGYGGSSAPAAVSAYDIRTLAADVIGLAQALGQPEFRLIGHDWGCIVAWHTALLHPAQCLAVMGMSVPHWRFGPAVLDPPGMDDRFWYIRYFQPSGVAEAELDADPERALKAIYWAASGDAPAGTFLRQLTSSRDSGLLDVLPAPPAALPAWLSAEALRYSAAQFRRSGFRGPLNWYRNFPTNDALTPELNGRQIAQPAAFVAGAADLGLEFDRRWRERLAAGLADARLIALVPGAGHWLQLEQPAATTDLMLEFLRGLE